MFFLRCCRSSLGGLGSRRYGDTRVATLRGVELLVLDHKQLYHLARNHPELMRRFEEVARVREEKICQLLVSDLAEWALWIFDVVSQTTQNAQYVSGRGVMSDTPLPQTSSGHGRDIAVPRRQFEDMFKSVGVELYDDRVALDLLSRLRAWSKAEGPWKTGPSPGRLGARTDSCPTDFVRRTEVQEWIEELSDSDFFTTAHYCRLRSKQLEEIHTPRNAASNAWRKLRNAQKVMAADSKGWKAASPYGHLPPEPASHTPFGAVQLDRTGQPLHPPPPVPAAATAPVTDSAAVAAAAAGAAADDARSDVLLETIRSDVVEMKAMTQRVRRHPHGYIAFAFVLHRLEFMPSWANPGRARIEMPP